MTVTATNGTGLELCCDVHQTATADGIAYAILCPTDTPIIVVDDDGVEVDDPDDSLLTAAADALSKHDLQLIRSAPLLTVRDTDPDPSGEADDSDPIDDLIIGIDGSGYSSLLGFTGPDGLTYEILTPLDPWFCIAQQDGEQWRILDHEHALQIAPIFGTDLEPLA